MIPTILVPTAQLTVFCARESTLALLVMLLSILSMAHVDLIVLLATTSTQCRTGVSSVCLHVPNAQLEPIAQLVNPTGPSMDRFAWVSALRVSILILPLPIVLNAPSQAVGFALPPPAKPVLPTYMPTTQMECWYNVPPTAPFRAPTQTTQQWNVFTATQTV